MKRIIHALCALLIASQTAYARSTATVEGTFVSRLTDIAHFYANEHEGLAPSSWADFQQYLDVPIDNAFGFVTPTKRYAFLSEPLLLVPPHEGELLIITRRPFRAGTRDDLREPGRYVIFRKPTGGFGASYLAEAYVQRVFRGSEHLLPTPDSEPERPYERQARWNSIITWTVVVLIGVFAFAFWCSRRFSRTPGSDDNT